MSNEVKHRTIKISLKEDAAFKELAKALPEMQVSIGGVLQTHNKLPLMVDHHAEILCWFAKGGKKGVKNYVKNVQASAKKQVEKLNDPKEILVKKSSILKAVGQVIRDIKNNN